MNTIEKRIQFLIASHQLSPSAFADRIGVQRSNVSHVLNGRNKPSFEFILKIIQAFPKVSAHWLLTGEQKADPIQTSVPTETPNVPQQLKQEEKVVKSSNKNAKKIVKTMVFYDDFTFDTYLPNEQ